MPAAKLVGDKSYSILTDHLGTPYEAYDENGEKVWSAEYDLYGNIHTLEGEKEFIPFRYQGQYEDVEFGLYYNRFRYYSPESGTYISQDPIRLAGNNPNFYGYTFDCNTEVDVWGLDCSKKKKKFYRYVGEGEYQAIIKSGKIPNTDIEGNLKKVYYTNRKYITAGRAKTHNQLPNKPKYRVEIDPDNIPDNKGFTRVDPKDNPDWGIGGGVESTTENAIPVDVSKITILKGG